MKNDETGKILNDKRQLNNFTYNSQSSLSSKFARNYEIKRKWTSASPAVIQ